MNSGCREEANRRDAIYGVRKSRFVKEDAMNGVPTGFICAAAAF